MILDASSVPASQEGPNENDLTLLADGKTIMFVMALSRSLQRMVVPQVG